MDEKFGKIGDTLQCYEGVCVQMKGKAAMANVEPSTVW